MIRGCIDAYLAGWWRTGSLQRDTQDPRRYNSADRPVPRLRVNRNRVTHFTLARHPAPLTTAARDSPYLSNEAFYFDVAFPALLTYFPLEVSHLIGRCGQMSGCHLFCRPEAGVVHCLSSTLCSADVLSPLEQFAIKPIDPVVSANRARRASWAFA
jgi:hypothetical protein